MDGYKYENVYADLSEYYWGLSPSKMCLKIIELIPPGRHLKVMDIGCGEGKDAVFLARCGYDVSAFDVSVSGVEKVKRLAEKANVHVNAFQANIWDYRLSCGYDILFSSGVLQYIKPELRDEIMSNYLTHTNEDGLHAFNVFVEKPFIAPPPEKEEHSYFWHSGLLLSFYRDWYVEESSEFIFDCNSSGTPHKHAMNLVYARSKGNDA